MSSESGGWLAISRLRGEQFRIGDDVEIKVVEARDGKAKLAIRAPRTTVVLREEVYASIQRERRQSATPAAYAAALGQAMKRE